jgi:hypothetical protein
MSTNFIHENLVIGNTVERLGIQPVLSKPRFNPYVDYFVPLITIVLICTLFNNFMTQLFAI